MFLSLCCYHLKWLSITISTRSLTWIKRDVCPYSFLEFVLCVTVGPCTGGSKGRGSPVMSPCSMASLPENLPGNAVCRLQMSPNRIVEPRIPLRELVALPRPLVVNYKLPPQKPRTPFGDRIVPLKHILWTRQCVCVWCFLKGRLHKYLK